MLFGSPAFGSRMQKDLPYLRVTCHISGGPLLSIHNHTHWTVLARTCGNCSACSETIINNGSYTQHCNSYMQQGCYLTCWDTSQHILSNLCRSASLPSSNDVHNTLVAWHMVPLCRQWPLLIASSLTGGAASAVPNCLLYSRLHYCRSPSLFEVTQQLYQGKLSQLWEAVHLPSGYLIALKRYNKKKLSSLNRFESKAIMACRSSFFRTLRALIKKSVFLEVIGALG